MKVGAEMDSEQLLTVAQSCERLSLSRNAVYALISAGTLPSVKIGSSRRVRVADLDEFIRSLREPSSETAA